MNSRKMERPGAPTVISDVTTALRSLLKRPRIGPPRRLLDLGWDAAADGDVLAEEVTVSDAVPETGDPVRPPFDAPFDAILWALDDARQDAADFQRVRQLLAEDGRLLARAPAGNGLSPAAVARVLVRCLSEAGFVVLKELLPEELGLPAGAVLLARRDDFVIRSYQEGDDGAIEKLFTDSFHVVRGRRHWRWKYHESPYGNRYISLAFSPEGELTSHYAGYPVPFWCDGRAFLGLQMSDTMTGPGFRQVGRGVSSLLARAVRHFFAVYRRGPFGFFYGFNTGGIQRFCGWFIGGSRVEAVRYRVRRHADALPPARGYRVERVERPGPAWDRFFRHVAPRYGFLVRRDADYVDWRYRRCPDGEPYVVLAAWRWRRLVGWSVFRRKEDRLVWGDALFHPRHVRAAGAVLAAALAAEELSGTTLVDGWFPDRPSWWDAELRCLGFEERPEPDKLGFMILPDTEEDPPLERLYYTMGDGDLF